MDDSKLLVELQISNRDFLRVYHYSYNAGLRITVSIENEDSVISSIHLTPCFDPFTGKRISMANTDSMTLQAGLSLKKANGKKIDHCCYLENGNLFLQVGETLKSCSLTYDMVTGIRNQMIS
ncbi:MAG: hypothetical protein WC136_05545 [Sphaerochaeta sp.]